MGSSLDNGLHSTAFTAIQRPALALLECMTCHALGIRALPVRTLRRMIALSFEGAVQSRSWDFR